MFAFHSIIQSLKAMARRPGFFEICEHWRDREAMGAGVLGDIYVDRSGMILNVLMEDHFLLCHIIYALDLI